MPPRRRIERSRAADTEAMAGAESGVHEVAGPSFATSPIRSSQCRLGRVRIILQVPLDGFMKELIAALVLAEHDFLQSARSQSLLNFHAEHVVVPIGNVAQEIHHLLDAGLVGIVLW